MPLWGFHPMRMATAKKERRKPFLKENQDALQAEIERLRKEMHDLAKLKGLQSVEVLRKSEELDKLINLYLLPKGETQV